MGTDFMKYYPVEGKVDFPFKTKEFIDKDNDFRKETLVHFLDLTKYGNMDSEDYKRSEIIEIMKSQLSPLEKQKRFTSSEILTKNIKQQDFRLRSHKSGSTLKPWFGRFIKSRFPNFPKLWLAAAAAHRGIASIDTGAAAVVEWFGEYHTAHFLWEEGIHWRLSEEMERRPGYGVAFW